MSWAFNLNPEDTWNLCENCQQDEFGGCPNGVVPIKTSAEKTNSILATQPSLTVASHTGRLPKRAVAILKAWFFSSDHVAHPYPTLPEKERLLQQTVINETQLTNWFKNTRKGSGNLHQNQSLQRQPKGKSRSNWLLFRHPNGKS